MHHVIAILLLFSQLASAQVENIIQFKGQNAETINIDKSVSVVRSVPVEVPSTCTRKVPYEAHECNDETRYREECQWVPEHQNCWDEPEEVCHPVNRTRQECHNGPSRRVCRDNPPRQVCTDRPDRQECSNVTRTRQECSNGPSREVCTERPTRQVCRERPTREVCRTNPRGGRSCQTVGGGQTCSTVGGGRTCNTVPGARSCRDVSYTDRVCRTVDGGSDCRTVGGGQSCHDEQGPRICRDINYTEQECTTVSRQRCETVPGENQCQNIPYTEQVCGNVTRYREENYACTRTEQQDRTFVKQLKGPISVKFLTNGLVEEFPLALVLAPKNEEHKEFVLKSQLKAEPEVLVVLRKSKVKTKESEKEIALDGEITFEVLEAKMVAPSFPGEFSEVSYDSEKEILSITFAGQISSLGSVDLTLTHRGWFGRSYVVAEFKGEYPSDLVKVKGNQILVDMKKAMEDRYPTAKMTLKAKLKAEVSVDGEILNTKKPQNEQEYESVRVTLE